MASIFKRGRDKEKKRACWYISYSDENGKRRSRKGFTDKGLTEQLAAQIEKDVWMRRNGMVDPRAEDLAKHRRSVFRRGDKGQDLPPVVLHGTSTK